MPHTVSCGSFGCQAQKQGGSMRNEIRLQAGLFTPEQMTRIRAAAHTARDLALVEVLATCRRAEAAALRWSDLRLDESLALIQRGKGGGASWTLLLPTTTAALAAWYICLLYTSPSPRDS